MARARWLALGVVLAWPTLAHANWLVDTIGHPITGGLAQGAHAVGGGMMTGVRETKAAFGSAAGSAGLKWTRAADELAIDDAAQTAPGVAQWDGFNWRACPAAGCFDGEPTPRPAGGDKMAPEAHLAPVAEPTVSAVVYNNTGARRVIEVYDAKTGAWTHRLAVQPWQKAPVLLHSDADGRAVAVLRWDHDPRFDVRYGGVGAGDELK
jgi:hypothetical protein